MTVLYTSEGRARHQKFRRATLTSMQARWMRSISSVGFAQRYTPVICRCCTLVYKTHIHKNSITLLKLPLATAHDGAAAEKSHMSAETVKIRRVKRVCQESPPVPTDIRLKHLNALRESRFHTSFQGLPRIIRLAHPSRSSSFNIPHQHIVETSGFFDSGQLICCFDGTDGEKRFIKCTDGGRVIFETVPYSTAAQVCFDVRFPRSAPIMQAASL